MNDADGEVRNNTTSAMSSPQAPAAPDTADGDLAVMLLLAIGVFASWKILDGRQQAYLKQAATALGLQFPVQSLKHAVDAYQVNFPWLRNANMQARSAVLTAASSPLSRVVAGLNPMMIGMKSTLESQHVVAYDAHGSILVIGDDGAVEREAKAAGAAPSPLCRGRPPSIRLFDLRWPATLEQLRGVGYFTRHLAGIDAHAGLPLAAPFLDGRVVEACLAVRLHERTTPWRFKPLIVEAMRNLVPAADLQTLHQGRLQCAAEGSGTMTVQLRGEVATADTDDGLVLLDERGAPACASLSSSPTPGWKPTANRSANRHAPATTAHSSSSPVEARVRELRSRNG